MGHEVLLGHRVTAPGRHYRRSVTVTYEYGGREWTQTSGAELIVCGGDQEPGECAPAG